MKDKESLRCTNHRFQRPTTDLYVLLSSQFRPQRKRRDFSAATTIKKSFTHTAGDVTQLKPRAEQSHQAYRNTNEIKTSASHALSSQEASEAIYRITSKDRGPFLERLGNFSGPKSHFKNHEAFYVQTFFDNRFCI